MDSTPEITNDKLKTVPYEEIEEPIKRRCLYLQHLQKKHDDLNSKWMPKLEKLN